jgi:hypothetical protein
LSDAFIFVSTDLCGGNRLVMLEVFELEEEEGEKESQTLHCVLSLSARCSLVSLVALSLSLSLSQSLSSPSLSLHSLSLYLSLSSLSSLSTYVLLLIDHNELCDSLSGSLLFRELRCLFFLNVRRRFETFADNLRTLTQVLAKGDE